MATPVRVGEEIREDGASGYAPHEHRPLAGYALITAVFNGAFGGLLAAGAARGRLPERLGAGDLLLAGVATHKLGRLLAKDKVTSFLRAPFARYEGSSGPSEVSESPRGRGLRLAVGELVTCPYCIGQWLAAGFVGGLAVATRAIAGTYTVLAVSDFLNVAYALGEERL